MGMVYGAVSIDLFSDGLLIGAGSALSKSLALVLASGQGLADVPEGYATRANMKARNVPQGRRLMLPAAFVLPVLAAARSDYLLRDQDDVHKMAMPAFTAGPLTMAAVEEMLSEAHESVRDCH